MESATTRNQRREQAQQTRLALLSAATELFAEKGFEATGVRDISRRAGLAAGLLYHYFPDGKKELLEAIVVRATREIIEEMEARVAEIERLPIETLCMRFYDYATEAIDRRARVLSIMLREMRLFGAEERLRILTAMQPWRGDRLAEILKERAAAGEIRQIDFECASLSLTSIIISYLFASLSGCGGAAGGESAGHRMVQYHVNLWKGGGA